MIRDFTTRKSYEPTTIERTYRITRPRPIEARNARTNDSTGPRPRTFTTATDVYAPTVMNSAWAKFGTRVTAYVIVSPTAIIVYRLPRRRDWRIGSANSTTIPPQPRAGSGVRDKDPCRSRVRMAR